MVNTLKKKNGWKSVESYTTRAKRYEGETGHTFITDEEFDNLENVCALTVFDEYRYCATQEQIDESDIFVVDPDGVDFFLEKYKGNKDVLTIELLADRRTRYIRMRARGDSIFKVIKRLKHDKWKFANSKSDIYINANQEALQVYRDFLNVNSLYKSIKKEKSRV